ncbi:MAG: outer membrane lipoprotein-sorting protein [Bryobacteraceae bacterium]|nr:outer membrane lipoprotein-sorting protein [Bryobacteraceae bacterium]MDW8380016.1 outer membrane lipoprotein-sorting protein [Bryobacterales bacterium]
MFFLLLAAQALAQDARQIMVEVQNRARSNSQHYEGVLKVVDSKSKVSEKRWTYDRIGSAGQSKVILRFTAPAEVKGVAVLVINHPDRASDQWMWTPSLQRDRRIALQDRSTRFFGTDFSFEDLEERDVEQFDYKLLGEEKCGESVCYKLESRPRKTKVSQYSHSFLWVEKERMIILRIEGYQRDRLVRRIQYSDHQKVQNIWTPLLIEVEDVGRKSKTILRTDKLQYNAPMKEEMFTLQALRRES